MPQCQKVRLRYSWEGPSSDLFTPTLAPSGLVVSSPVPSHLTPNHSLVFLFRTRIGSPRLHQGSAEAGAPCLSSLHEATSCRMPGEAGRGHS